jgi:3-oxoacyl-(acyl-carrier-protein) synthase
VSAAQNIFVQGIGAVSPAGWGVLPLREALAKGEPMPVKELTRPGWARSLRVRPVPPPCPRPNFLAHARLRRTSPITQYAVAAALEALGNHTAHVSNGSLRLGIIFCVMTGCVNYSRRFYDETLNDPATASPLVFPETVFNAPASHLAALLGTAAINYTLVGDPGTMLQGLALAADWLLEGRIDGCLVVGAEEIDWLTSDAYGLFARKVVLSEGAGAVYLRRLDPPTPEPSQEGHGPNGSERWLPSSEGPGLGSSAAISSRIPDHCIVHLHSVTESYLYVRRQIRGQAAKRMRAEMPAGKPEHLLCDGTQGVRSLDTAELEAWRDWPGARSSPKGVLGEGLAAASAWQCVAALDALRQGQHPEASVSVVGCNEQAIGAHFVVSDRHFQNSNSPESETSGKAGDLKS